MGKRNNLIKLRKALGLTQDYMAAATGIDRSLYCRFETGERRPDIEQARKIAAALNYKHYDRGGLFDETDDQDQDNGSEN